MRSSVRAIATGWPVSRRVVSTSTSAATGDTFWGYERGRLLACWILTTDVPPPAASDVEALVLLYRAAEDADVLL
jgi:hypothetical protein